MKFLLLSAFSLLLSQGILAQISLTSSDLASPGDVINNRFVNFSNPLPVGGANQTYNFQLTDTEAEEDTTYFLSAASTPFAAAMAGANLASLNGGSYTYFEKDVSGFYLRGIVFPIPPLPINIPVQDAPLRFNPRIPILTFPATMGMNHRTQSTARFEFDFDTTITLGFLTFNITKIALVATIRDTSIIDGFGTGNFNVGELPCLRNIHSTRTSFKVQMFGSAFGPPSWIDVPAAILPPIEDFYSTDILVWTKERKAPVVTFGLDAEGNLSFTDMQREVLLTSNHFLKAPVKQLHIFPNPSSGRFQLGAKESLFDLKIMDSNGRLVFEKPMLTPGENLNAENLPTGLYWISAQGADGQSLLHQRIHIAR